MRNWMKQHPPYEGEQPYLYLAFADTDRGRVWKIMKLLLERGCRVWYCCGLPGDAAEVRRRQERSGGAALTVLYLTDAAAADRDTKSNVLVNQKFDRPILCLDPDGTDRRLSMGLHETVPHIPLYTLTDSADMENAIIHADGFSQEIDSSVAAIARRMTDSLSRTLADGSYANGMKHKPMRSKVRSAPIIDCSKEASALAGKSSNTSITSNVLPSITNARTVSSAVFVRCTARALF